MDEDTKAKIKFFHSKEKGCVMESYSFISDSSIRSKKDVHLINGQKCITHKVNKICRCGWLFKKHYVK